MANVNVELSHDDALMLADACLIQMWHYKKMVADAAELGTVSNISEISRSWIEQIKYWRDLYNRLFTAAVEPESLHTKLPDISGGIFSRRKAEGE